MKQTDFQKIFRSSFRDSDEWQKWFFSRVAVSDDEIYLTDDDSGQPASALLMQPYGFRFCGMDLESVYISCVATLPDSRAKGLSSRLMRQALESAREKGKILAELIPADSYLYNFYSKFGFETVFYADVEHYTSLHSFACADFQAVDPEYSIYHSLELRSGSGVIHSEMDYLNITDDLRFEPAHEIVAVRNDSGQSAILFAAFDPMRPDSPVNVRSLLADTDEAATAVLAELRHRAGQRPFTVCRRPKPDSRILMRPRGMIRILDADVLLAALASAHPHLRATIRINDNIIAANNTTLTVSGGSVHPASGDNRPDLDVDIATLAGILFGSDRTGEIFGLPASRPYMAMMLDQ